MSGGVAVAIRYSVLVFPINLFDNAFSGAAYCSDIFSVANSFNTGDIFQPSDCINDEEGYSYKYADWSSIVNLLYAPAASLYGADFGILINNFSMLAPLNHTTFESPSMIAITVRNTASTES